MNFSDFRNQLEKSSSDWFLKMGFPTREKQPYILRHKTDWRKNIILPEVFDYILESKRNRNYPFPLHPWLHHGLSSQAMIFNLIGSLVVKNSLGILRETFEEAGVVWPAQISGEFEYQNPLVFNELQSQPTSLDFVIKDQTNEPKILIEAKLVEKSFGLCSRLENTVCTGLNPLNENLKKECELANIGREYWKVLLENRVLTSQTLGSPICPMSIFYQFYREVGFAVKTKSQLVFLVDERNPFFSPDNKNSLPNRLRNSLNQDIQGVVKILIIQRVFAAIKKHFDGNNWVRSLGEKYALL